MLHFYFHYFQQEQDPESEVDTTLEYSKDGYYFSRLLKLIVKALNLKWFTDPVFLLMLASEYTLQC